MNTTKAVVMPTPYENELKEAALKVREAADALKSIRDHADEVGGDDAETMGSSTPGSQRLAQLDRLISTLTIAADEIAPEAGFID